MRLFTLNVRGYRHKKYLSKVIDISEKLFLMISFTYLLGSEVNKLSKIYIKTSNTAEYIESDVQNIKAPRTNDPTI